MAFRVRRGYLNPRAVCFTLKAMQDTYIPAPEVDAENLVPYARKSYP